MDWIKGYYFQVKHELHHRVNLTLYTNQHQDEIPYLIQLRKFIKVNWFAQLIYSEFSKKISFLKAFETDTVHFVKLSTITKTRAVHGSFTAECWRRMIAFFIRLIRGHFVWKTLSMSPRQEFQQRWWIKFCNQSPIKILGVVIMSTFYLGMKFKIILI